ncbi:hypothetical protein CCR80_09590 [Rhodothalassium salexigens]|uniref:polysaccharide biosynthesis/export family protein n=1 Tax=Rhodothalassium salexigens TaxID=1086 RepID=UPI001912BAFE|nr:polysaccharide biosynthesis/export family protein [Rhodothalassium salexigens]MBK5921281.1 hypothetical protein [Rhodothalassium salexigens]
MTRPLLSLPLPALVLPSLPIVGTIAAGLLAGPSLAPAAGAQESPPGVATEQDAYVYRIGPDDTIDIQVRGEPDLSRSYPVRPDGFVALPLIGDIAVAGKTTEALAADLTRALARFIQSPQVSVEVVEAAGLLPDRVRVVGSAVDPRAVPYRDGMVVATVLDAIGGAPEGAALSSVYLIRRTDAGDKRIPLDLGGGVQGARFAAGFEVLPGDTLVIPKGFLAGDTEFSLGLGVSQSYSDNLFLAPEGFEDDGMITSVTPSFTLSADTDRLDAAAFGSAGLQFITQTDNNDIRVAPNAQGSLNLEALEDLFFVDASAAVTRAQINPGAPRSFNQANVQNQRILQSYRVSPHVKGTLGDLAQYELRYRGGVVLVGNTALTNDNLRVPTAQPGNTVTHRGELTMESVPVGQRLSLRLNAFWSSIDPENQAVRNRREAIVRAEYAVAGGFFLVAEAGYQYFDADDFAVSVDDAQIFGGFRWAPNEAFEVEVLGGRRDGDETVQADLSYTLDERLEVSFRYENRPQIDQQRLLDNLPATPDEVEDTGPAAPPFAFTGDPTRLEVLRGSINALFGRLSVNVSASRQERRLGVVGGDRDQKSLIGEAGLSYLFPFDVSFGVTGLYQRNDFSAIDDLRAFRRDENVNGRVSLTYLGFERFSVTAAYAYATRDSSFGVNSFTENSVTLSLNAQF